MSSSPVERRYTRQYAQQRDQRDVEAGMFDDEGFSSRAWSGEETAVGLESPVLVSPERASDYAMMSMSSATPPPSDVSVKTYLRRLVDIVKKVYGLPWMSRERVTVDYYPGGEKEGKKKKKDSEDLYDRSMVHATAVSWKSREYTAWRQSHYGHVAAGGGSPGAYGPGSAGALSASSSGTMSPDSVAGVIEPFPFTGTQS
ncbi:hypothetical protein P691DRAFT_759624 [Macrolepiota fuliginosa MF-IS2]|uniref:Uncharacterized protein n=1 Tax=Macrolepiota fuliginosa MF-IS2 TaxID=1400762 RepID=A0A9P6C2E0_9AGAR|nr:hypothetical protein P691DRAFT_759624 [Macrolepiota fuliginosa MF-IS2]